MEEVEHIAGAVFRLYFRLGFFFFNRVFRSWLRNGTFLTSETSNFFCFLPYPLFFFFPHFLQTGVLHSCIALVFFLRCMAHLQSFINIIISLHFLVVHIVSSDESICACDFLRRRQNLHVSA